MVKKKRESFLWRFIKLLFRGIGKIFSGIFYLVKRKMSERKERKTLEKNKVYTANAKLNELNLIKGDKVLFKDLENRLHKKSLILLIFGKRGSGKSALGFRLIENIYAKEKRNCYALSISQHLIPNWIKSIDSINDVKNNGVLLVDEGAISFGARDSMKVKNKELSNIMAIARHKNITLIFIVQNTSMLDKNILKLTDTLFVKEGSLLQLEMERPEIKKFYEKASKACGKLKADKKKSVYIIDSDFEGVIEYALPSFWTEQISKSKA